MHAALSDDPARPAAVVRRQYLAAATGDLETYTVRGGKIVPFEQFVDSALVRQAMR